MSQLCRYGFSKLKIPRIELGVYPSNRRAIACYRGFRDEALLRRFVYHDGEWVDVLLMSLLRSEWREKIGIEPTSLLAKTNWF